jgi:Ca2+-binding EF-hand superfamily protein
MTVSGLGQSMSILSMLQMKLPSANDIASKIMKKLDTNGDGVLSADEISKGGERAKMILGADANGDGNVTLDELLADISKHQKGSMEGMQPPSASDIASKIMKELDTNGDGVLSTDEISKSGQNAKMIQAADANGDGKVTMDELIADISKNQQSIGKMHSHHGAGGMVGRIMDALDTNGDGSLSTSDTSTSGANSTIIQAADANKDGKVTMEELLAYISKQYGETQTMTETEQSSNLSLVA